MSPVPRPRPARSPVAPPRLLLRGASVVLAVVGALASGGCRGAVAAGPDRTSAVGSTAAADPLSGVERTLDTIEEQVDRDGTG